MDHVSGGGIERLNYASAITPGGQRLAPRQVRDLCLLLLIGISVFFWLDASARVWLPLYSDVDIASHPMPDFEYFYKGGAWLLNRGGLDQGYDFRPDGRLARRGMLDWYLPFVPRLMTVIAWLPSWGAGCVWVALNIACMIGCLRLIGRNLMDLPPRDWPVTQILPLIFLIAYWATEFKLNQINCLTLMLLVASFVQWQDGRKALSGFWLGLATLIKLTPALVLFWFVLKREYRTASIAVLTIMLAGPVSDVVVFGPEAAMDSYRGWVRNAVHSGSHAGLISEQREMDWRNQGMGAVLSRWLHSTNWATRFDNEPRATSLTAEPQVLNIVDLPVYGVAWIANGIIGASVCGMILLARRPAARLSAWELRFEWSLFVLAMLWTMPVMRQYHMIWACPAMSMIAAGVAKFHSRGWRGLAFVSIAGAIVAQICLVSKEAKAMGITLASVALLALPIIVALVRFRGGAGGCGDGRGLVNVSVASE